MALLIAVAAIAPRTASAGDEKLGRNPDQAGVYAAPMPAAAPFPGAFAFQRPTPWCYTFPIQSAYQFPAVIAGQPGAEVAYLTVNPANGLLGGRPYLYHP